MQITKFTDLALRVLMYLTYEDNLSSVTISEIAQQFEVPRNHLIKVVTKLNKLGWIYATRGRNGGLRLEIDPANLKLGDILEKLENKTSLINCHTPPCVIRGRCHLKAVLDLGLRNFYNDMNKYSLKDIVDPKTKQAVIKLHKDYIAA